MDNIQKLALMSLIMLFVIIGLWTLNPSMASLGGSTYIAILIGALFEIKKYHNKNIYLAITAFILILGLILTYIYAIRLNYVQDTNKLIFIILMGLVAGGIFGMALIRANSWKNGKNPNSNT